MLIGYSMPAATISTGSTASWVSDDDGEAMLDGKPARRTRIAHGWEIPLTSSQYVPLVLQFSGAEPIRIVGLLGLVGVAVGGLVELYGRRSGDAGRTYTFGGGNTGQVVQFADGSYGVWIVLGAAAAAVTELEARVVNSDGGAAWGTPGGTFDVGEFVAMPAIDVGIRDGWAISTVDPTAFQWTRGSQRVGVARRSYRQLSATITPRATADVRGGGLTGGTDLERVAAAMAGNARAVCIPQWRTAGVQDNALIQRTAVYGSASEVPAAVNVSGGYFEASLVLDEVPG
jgi:hypothetical protein